MSDGDSEYGSLPDPSDQYAAQWPTLKDHKVDDLVQMYRDHREILDAARKHYNQVEANEKDLMSRIGMALRDKADALGVTSFATPAGTAYRVVKEKYRVGNWDKFVEYVKENEYWHLLEKRVAKLAAKEIHEQRKQQVVPVDEEFDPVPPGLEYLSEIEFAVRKPTTQVKRNRS